LQNLTSLIVAPRFPEPVPPEFYRLTGLLRFGIVFSVIATTFPIGLVAEEAGFRQDVYCREDHSDVLGEVDCFAAANEPSDHVVAVDEWTQSREDHSVAERITPTYSVKLTVSRPQMSRAIT